MKTYILQKDLPDVKAGAEFELIGNKYHVTNHNPISDSVYVLDKKFVENNDGTWFKEKKEERKITPMVITTAWDKVKPEITFSFGQTYPDIITISAVRLAEILIADSKQLLCIISNDFTVSNTGEKIKLYTEKELLEAEEKAFNAARKVWTSSIAQEFIGEYQFPTFQDYINQVKK